MPDILYHYTSMETLFAILSQLEKRDMTLRATHVNYLNDRTENEIGVSILKNQLLKYESSLSKSESKELNEKLDNEKLNFFKNISFDKLPPFIFSLSEEKDSLPMWNTYADNSLGVAIGFNLKKLEEFVEKIPEMDLIKCEYEHSATNKFIEANIKDFYKTLNIEKLFIGVTSSKNFDKWNEFEKLILELKHPAFIYEKEWRIVIRQYFDYFANSNFDKMEFTVKNGLPKPFIEFGFDIGIIKEIVIGPSSNFNLVSKSLSMILNKKNVKSTISEPHIFPYEDDFILISQSTCPFRQI